MDEKPLHSLKTKRNQTFEEASSMLDNKLSNSGIYKNSRHSKLVKLHNFTNYETLLKQNLSTIIKKWDGIKI